MTIAATWTKLTASEPLQRSSVCVSVSGSTVYVFGGELKPRQPRDNNVHTILLGDGNATTTKTISAGNAGPSPRVGAATTSLGGNIYMFSGRGGEAMAPIEDNGRLWVLEASSESWTTVSPKSDTYPEARSYHCMASNNSDTIYVHAGCPEQGRRSDLWAFNIHNHHWKELAPAPDPPRGGTSIAFVDGKLYRMNGFDGKEEQGGSLDVYDTASNSWSTLSFAADGKTGPGARSVSALVPVSSSKGTLLVTIFGESDPSSLGHQGAGKMLSDGWAYSLSDRAWSKIEVQSSEIPQARGWFDADVVSQNGREGVVIVGGLGESNERLNDAWLLSI